MLLFAFNFNFEHCEHVRKRRPEGANCIVFRTSEDQDPQRMNFYSAFLVLMRDEKKEKQIE